MLNRRVGIQLKSRSFSPPENITGAIQSYIRPSGQERVHVLMQFHDIPDIGRRGILENSAVNLLNYVPQKTWFASVPRGIAQAQLRNANVRWIGPILPEDKISLAVKNSNYVNNVDGTINLSVRFFSDVDLDDASLMIEDYGQVVDRFNPTNTLKLVIEEESVLDIAMEDSVQWIDVIDKVLQRHNDGSRENVGVNTLQAAPYSLSGIDIVTAQWDGGWADTTHDDLEGRVIIGDSGCAESDCQTDDHATHVAGTMLGDGTLSAVRSGSDLQWRGMAPQATLIGFEWWDDSTELNNEYDSAINTYDASLSQNSWGYEYLACGSDCSGGYDAECAQLDGIVRGSMGKRITLIWSSGNKRPGDSDDGSYDGIGIPGTAKNVITVGATNSDDDSMTSFSSWGPTNDGRIKPDVTAPGCEVGGEGHIHSTLPGDIYGDPGWCGTSMAAPAVSGVVALMLEEFGYMAEYPLPSTIKAILIHAALDLGNTGPDYSFGYGRVDAVAAIDGIVVGSYVEDECNDGSANTHSLYVPEGTTEVKITLAWDDEPAAANANPTLVNDLDLVVTDPDGVRHYPWTLDPDNPSNPAVQTQEDHTNNVEQVVVDSSIVAGEWTIEVYGDSVPYAPQLYSLAFTPDYGDSVEGSTYNDSGYSEAERFFDRTDTVYVEAYVLSDGNPHTGATVTAALELSDGTPVTTIGLVHVGGGYYRNSWDSTGGTADVYSVDIDVVDPAVSSTERFHVYPQSGVSAYRLDYDDDGNDDYALENRHVIAVFDGETGADKLLLYLSQKDTGTDYTFGDISDADSRGTGEVTTTNMKELLFSLHLFSSEGENLSSVTLDMDAMDAYVSDPTEELITYYDTSNGASLDGNFFVDNDQWIGERFDSADLDDDYTLTKVSVYVDKGNGASDPLIVEIRSDSSGVPSNTVLTSESIPASSVPSNPAWLDVTFTSQITLQQGGLYWLVVRSVDNRGGGPNFAYTWTGDNTSPSYPGQMGFSQNQGLSWTDGSASYDMIFKVYGYPVAITASFDLAIQMKTEDVDYLVYKAFNFDEYIDDINDIFSPISGSLGSSVDDDRYHIGDGTDGLVNGLASETWTDFGSLTDEQRYVAIYDDSSPVDGVDDNVISWVYFPNVATVSFQGVGSWYETGREALRIRYDTSSATGTNEAEYLLVFTQGGYSAIDQWMSTVAGGSLPTLNFMTAPTVLGIEITSEYLPDPKHWNIGAVSLNDVQESDTFTVENTGSVVEDISISGGDGSSGWTIENNVGENSFKVEADRNDDGSYELVLSTSDQTFATDVPVSGTETLGVRYSAPSSDTVGGGVDQSFTITVTASESLP